MEEPALLSRHICSPVRTEEALNQQPFIAFLRTCVCASVILQVSGGGELLATVLLLADERLLAVVSAHVDLQPLQHVEALPAALGATPEHSVIPWRRERAGEVRI